MKHLSTNMWKQQNLKQKSCAHMLSCLGGISKHCGTGQVKEGAVTFGKKTQIPDVRSLRYTLLQQRMPESRLGETQISLCSPIVDYDMQFRSASQKKTMHMYLTVLKQVYLDIVCKYVALLYR